MSLWTPAEVVSTLWLDFSDASTVTLAAGKIAQVNDKSGNLYHALQANTTFQPTYTLAGINGLNVALFDGTNDGMAGASPLPVGPKSVFYVAKSYNSIGGEIFQSSSGPAPFFAYLFRMLRGGGISFVGGDTRLVNVTTSAIDFSTSFQSPFLAASTISNSLAWSFYYNDEIYPTTGAVNAENALGGYQVGNLFALARSQFWPGMIGEIIVYSGEATTELRQLTSGYLAWKWGIQSLLASNHPYKNAAPTKASPVQIFAAAHNAVRGAL